MSELHMPDSPNGGYRRLAKTERIVSIADDGELFIVRPDDVHERIVRCKDCRNLYSRTPPDEGFACIGDGASVPLDGFCAWGVARDGA